MSGATSLLTPWKGVRCPVSDIIVTEKSKAFVSLGVRCEMSDRDVKSSTFCNPKEQNQDDNKKMILKKI